MGLPLPTVPADVAATLAATGRLPSAALAAWLTGDGLDVTTAMAAVLPLAAARSQPPVSGFRVGAVAIGLPPDDGRGPGNLYWGANLEFAGLPLGMAVHAEQAAVNQAWLAGETGLQSIAVTAAPCGHCRQFLWELCTAKELQVAIITDPCQPRTWRQTNLSRLLPRPFGPRDLGFAGGLMSPTTQSLKRSGNELQLTAIEAAERSYAPYSRNLAGAALRLSDGRIVVGRTAENAAYNPSLPPLQSALSALAVGPTQGDAAIVEVVLAEAATRVSQRQSTELLLRTVAPHVPLDYVAAQPDSLAAESS